MSLLNTLKGKYSNFSEMEVEVCILQLKSRVEPTRSLVLSEDYFYIVTIKMAFT